MAQAHLRYPIILSIVAAVVTILLKSAAYTITGSVGLLSDAAESGINLLAALTAYLSLWYAARPVDPSHTYGHEKIEYFSSGLEGTLIVVAAAGIAYFAIRRLFVPEELHSLDVGTIIALVASLINFGVARVLLHVGHKHGSIVLEADGQHLMTDVWTSLVVVAGLGLVWLTKLHWLDSIVALLMAGMIVWTGCDLVRRSFNGLMDHALSAEEQAKVRAAIEAHAEPGMHYHALRTRQAASRQFADFHLLVPGIYTVSRAHALVNRIEAAIKAVLPTMEVTIHIEPIEEQTSWEDSELLSVEQAEAAKRAEGKGGPNPQ